MAFKKPIDKAHGSKEHTTRLNAPFSNKMRNFGDPTYQLKVRRGRISHASTNYLGLRGRVEFLFNPSTVTIDHPISLDLFAGQGGSNTTAHDAGSDAVLGGVVGSTSFDLLFDRTFEMLEPHAVPLNGGPSFADIGVYEDVMAIYKFCGIVDKDAKYQFGNDRKLHSDASFPTNTPGPTNAYVSLGALRFYGAISGISVTYTHWSARMVPMRCAVSIGFSMYNSATNFALSPSDVKQVDAWKGKASTK